MNFEPWIRRLPGQPLRAADWNEVQVCIRRAIAERPSGPGVGPDCDGHETRIATLEADVLRLRDQVDALSASVSSGGTASYAARGLSEAVYLANTRSRVIHHRDCPFAGRISAANRHPQTSYLDGEAVTAMLSSGYNGCRGCLHSYDSDLSVTHVDHDDEETS